MLEKCGSAYLVCVSVLVLAASCLCPWAYRQWVSVYMCVWMVGKGCVRQYTLCSAPDGPCVCPQFWSVCVFVPCTE